MDSVTAAAYNVIFTSVPILIFAVVDRPVQHFETLIRYPQARAWFPLQNMGLEAWAIALREQDRRFVIGRVLAQHWCPPLARAHYWPAMRRLKLAEVPIPWQP